VKIELFADTTCSRFAEWLNHYTQTAKTTLNADDGSFYGLNVPPERIHSNPDSAEIVINAYHTHEGLYDPLPGVFRFEILQLASERIKVVVSCSIMLPVFVGYFEALLKEIAKTWPETEADFRRQSVPSLLWIDSLAVRPIIENLANEQFDDFQAETLKQKLVGDYQQGVPPDIKPDNESDIVILSLL
jgi:hypothetical protein